MNVTNFPNAGNNVPGFGQGFNLGGGAAQGLQNFGGLQGLQGLQGFTGNGNSAINSLLQTAGSLPTGTGTATPQSGEASFSPNGNPGFGGMSTEQMAQMINEAMKTLTAFLGAQNANGAQANGAQGVPAASGGGSSDGGGGGGAPVSGGSAPASGTGSTGGAAPASDSKDEGEIKSFIAQAAGAYGADPKVLTEMARRESSFKTGETNGWDSNAKKGTPSKGLFQFIEPTFKSMAPKAKAANPGAWEGVGELNWNDWRQQALTASWAVANGQGSHWSTYKAAGGK